MFKHYSFSAHERNRLFVNAHGRHFVEAGYALGIDVDLEGRGVAVADLDRDGRLDLLVRSVARQKVTYWHNEVEPRAGFLRVALRGRSGNRDAVGAVVRLRAGGAAEQMRLVQAGNGFQAQSEGTLHFGLGAAERVDELQVRWPSGREESFADLPADHRVEIVEGEGRVELSRPPGWRPAEDVVPPPTSTAWRARNLDGRLYRPPAGKPLLLAFWASWCQPCHAEVAHLNALRRRFGDRLEIVGLSLADGAGEARDFARRTAPEYPLLTATPDDLAGLLEAAFGDGVLPLPSSVLLDGDGRPQRVFGAVSPQVLEQQTRRLIPPEPH